MDDKPFLPSYQISIERAKGLGIDFIPLEVSLKETIEGSTKNFFISFRVFLGPSYQNK